MAWAWVSTRRLARLPICGWDTGARGATAFTVALRQLIDAEAFVFVGVEILAQAKLGFLRRLQKNLLHRIAGVRLVDRERAALAVILAVKKYGSTSANDQPVLPGETH